MMRRENVSNGGENKSDGHHSTEIAQVQLQLQSYHQDLSGFKATIPSTRSVKT